MLDGVTPSTHDVIDVARCCEAAVATKRIAAGTLVSNAGYRNPALFARMVDTVDDLSDGRVILALGAGDFETGHRALPGAKPNYGSVMQITERFAELASQGVEHESIMLHPWTTERVEKFAAVIAALKR